MVLSNVYSYEYYIQIVIYSFMYKSFIRKILIATVYFFHSPFLTPLGAIS